MMQIHTHVNTILALDYKANGTYHKHTHEIQDENQSG
jgi:hypothetical protein